MTQTKDETIDCPDCNTRSPVKDLTIKMGGLLCPKCRRILVLPYHDLYRKELYRRREQEADEKDI